MSREVVQMAKKRKRLTKEDRDFYQGFAVAVGFFARDCDLPSVAVDCMNMNGITLQHLADSGVEPFDFEPLAKEWYAQGGQRLSRRKSGGKG